MLLLEGVSKLKEKARRKKGRGFDDKSKRDIKDEPMEFESVDQTDDDGPGPQRCNIIIYYYYLYLCIYMSLVK